MSEEDRQVLEALDRENRKWNAIERVLVAAILVIGVVLALAVGYLITDEDEGYRSVTCERGDVVLLLERGDGSIERVECPAGTAVKP